MYVARIFNRIVSRQIHTSRSRIHCTIVGPFNTGVPLFRMRFHVKSFRFAAGVLGAEVARMDDAALFEDVQITMFADPVILKPVDVVLRRCARTTGKIDNGIVALARSQPGILFVVVFFRFFLVIPGRVELDEMKFYEA